MYQPYSVFTISCLFHSPELAAFIAEQVTKGTAKLRGQVSPCQDADGDLGRLLPEQPRLSSLRHRARQQVVSPHLELQQFHLFQYLRSRSPRRDLLSRLWPPQPAEPPVVVHTLTSRLQPNPALPTTPTKSSSLNILPIPLSSWQNVACPLSRPIRSVNFVNNHCFPAQIILPSFSGAYAPLHHSAGLPVRLRRGRDS
jgi:hypothetical protein